MSERIEKLRDAVQVMHQCSAAHVGSVPVIQMLGEKVAWEGVVEVFAITGHPKAARCYAWGFLEEGNHSRYILKDPKAQKGLQFATVLEIPPVDSAQTAVTAYIGSLIKNLGTG